MTNEPDLHFRTAGEQMAGLDVVARAAASRGTNVAVMQVDHEILGIVAVGVPPAEALQVVYVVTGYDIWSHGGRQMDSSNVSAEVAAEALVRQYLEYKRRRIQNTR